MKSNKITESRTRSILENDRDECSESNRVKNYEKKTNVTKRTEKNRLKQQVPDDRNELDGMDRMPTAVVERIEKSELDLVGYTEEGSQLVTNVLLANNNRENNRRNTDKCERDVRLKAVELESEIANAKFMEISSQWPIILKKNDALEIHEHSELQKKRGLDLIEQKNQMIERLKRDLAESDSRFLEEQRAQSEDVRILQERIENQMKFIRKQYKNHIQYIKSTMDEQRELKIHKCTVGWKKLYDDTMSIESSSLDDRLAMIEKKENNIVKQYEMNEEAIRNLKTTMNTELQHVQREFELIKMKCLENVEKLNYNYQVLKRREEENASAKSAQRRKINKLQDILSTKRKILREIKTEFKTKVPLLRDEIEKLKQDIERQDKKAERFAEIQEKTYNELWDFSQDQIANRLERIFEIDRIIHETQLCVDWRPPQKIKYLDVTHLPTYKKKPNTPNDVDNLQVERNDRHRNAADSSYTESRERALMRLIFDATVKNSVHVLDDELVEIVKSHPTGNLTLLYNAMAAYGLDDTDSWNVLLSYTRSMVTCTVCRAPVLWQKTDQDQPPNADSEWKTESENKLIESVLSYSKNHMAYIEKTLSNAAVEKTQSKKYITLFKQKQTQLVSIRSTEVNEYQSFEHANTDSDGSTITFSLSLTDFEQLCSENDSNTVIKSQQYSFSQGELENYQTDLEGQNGSHDFTEDSSFKIGQNIDGERDFNAQRFLCDNPEHQLTITDTDYLQSVQKSINTSKSKALNQRGKNDSDYYITKTLSVKDVRDYWKQFLYAFPENRLKTWDIFDKAIKKYYQTLHLRFKKIKEVEKLETENMELKKILKQFMDAEQDDVRLQNICTPKIRRRETNSLKIKSKPATSLDNFTNVCGTSVHIFTVDRPIKKTNNRPFTAPMK